MKKYITLLLLVIGLGVNAQTFDFTCGEREYSLDCGGEEEVTIFSEFEIITEASDSAEQCRLLTIDPEFPFIQEITIRIRITANERFNQGRTVSLIAPYDPALSYRVVYTYNEELDQGENGEFNTQFTLEPITDGS